MCGICGIVPGPGNGPADLDLLKRMIGCLAHRGPDSCGFYRDRRAALGHSRLAIIDLIGGAQPLSNEDGTVWISFNGEIFNYLELQQELAAGGHIMRTCSDTEVIVHAWEEWGSACFERFNGQWAIALWDSSRGKLVLARDRLGIRPLYYIGGPKRFAFASEVKALFVDRSAARGLDPEGLAEILTFWCPVAPRTVFRGVRQVRPGHYLELSADTLSVSERPYWSVDFSAAEDGLVSDVALQAEKLRGELADAARLRFTRSDVPVGAYVSGGLDSSVTAAVVCGRTDSPLSTFSLRFTDPEFDEGSYQQQLVDRLGSEHHQVTIERASIAEVFPEVVWHAEQPLLRTAPAPLFLLSRLARDHGFKVVVTGEGADEVLAGYDIFRELKVRLFLARDPSSRSRSAVMERLYPWLARTPGRTPAFARAFFSNNLDPDDAAVSHRPRWDTTSALMHLLDPRWYREVAAVPVDQELLARLPSEHKRWDPVARAQWIEMTTLLPGYILSAQGDRMLMAHSVEGRFPFLDHNLVHYAASLPMHLKLFALDEKHLLKQAFGDAVPHQILLRPKQPYRAPDAASFFGSGSTPPAWLTELLSPSSVRRAGIFRGDAVQKLITKCKRMSGRDMSNTDNMRLVAVLSTMLLYHQYIMGNGYAQREHAGPITAIDRV